MPIIFLIFAATHARLSPTLVARPFIPHVIDGHTVEMHAQDGVGFLNSSIERGEPQQDAALDHPRAPAAARSGGRSAHAAQKAAGAGALCRCECLMATMAVLELSSWPVSATAGDQRLALDVSSARPAQTALEDRVRTCGIVLRAYCKK